MISTFKIKTQNNQIKVWLGSDFHLGHICLGWENPLWKSRGYNSVEDHDSGIINKINKSVNPDDYLLFCGDFCLNTSLEQFQSYCRRINCRNLVFVAGNHNNPWWKFYKDLVFNKYKEEIEVYPFRWENIIFVGESVDVQVDKFTFHLSHFPKLIWDKQQHERGHGSGHSHGSCKWTPPETKENKIVDLGWDVWHDVVSLEEFIRTLNKKVVVKHDHH